MVESLLSQLAFAVVFLMVETVFFVALHTYFQRPMDRMKHWFGRHSRRTVVALFPVLFLLNFALTVALSSRYQTTEAQETSTEARQTELESKPSAPTREPHEETAPLPGAPADDTWWSTPSESD